VAREHGATRAIVAGALSWVQHGTSVCKSPARATGMPSSSHHLHAPAPSEAPELTVSPCAPRGRACACWVRRTSSTSRTTRHSGRRAPRPIRPGGARRPARARSLPRGAPLRSWHRARGGEGPLKLDQRALRGAAQHGARSSPAARAGRVRRTGRHGGPRMSNRDHGRIYRADARRTRPSPVRGSMAVAPSASPSRRITSVSPSCPLSFSRNVTRKVSPLVPARGLHLPRLAPARRVRDAATGARRARPTRFRRRHEGVHQRVRHRAGQHAPSEASGPRPRPTPSATASHLVLHAGAHGREVHQPLQRFAVPRLGGGLQRMQGQVRREYSQTAPTQSDRKRRGRRRCSCAWRSVGERWRQMSADALLTPTVAERVRRVNATRAWPPAREPPAPGI
jgi:hypothetical protein